MLKHTIKIVLMAFSACTFAGSLPINAKLTPINAKAYSVELRKVDSVSTGINLYQLEFSRQLEACQAGRVQTALFNGGEEISG